MKILFQIAGQELGGIETVVGSLVRRLTAGGVPSVIATSLGPSATYLESLGAKIESLPNQISGWDELINKVKPTTVVFSTHPWVLCGLPSAFRMKIPSLWMYQYPQSHFFKFQEGALTCLLAMFSKVIAPSHYMLSELGQSPGDQIEVVPNCVDVQRFTRRGVRDLVRRQLGFAQDDFVLGYVSRFELRKRHSYLLQVFREVQKLIPEARLLLVGRHERIGGDGDSSLSVWDQVNQSGLQESVKFVACDPSSVRDFFEVMDLQVFPASHEAFGCAVSEAMAMELPQVLVDHGAFPGFPKVNEYAEIVPLEDVTAMVASIVRFYRNPSLRAKMGRKAREVAEGFFSLEAMQREYLRCFH